MNSRRQSRRARLRGEADRRRDKSRGPSCNRPGERERPGIIGSPQLATDASVSRTGVENKDRILCVRPLNDRSASFLGCSDRDEQRQSTSRPVARFSTLLLRNGCPTTSHRPGSPTPAEVRGRIARSFHRAARDHHRLGRRPGPGARSCSLSIDPSGEFLGRSSQQRRSDPSWPASACATIRARS